MLIVPVIESDCSIRKYEVTRSISRDGFIDLLGFVVALKDIIHLMSVSEDGKFIVTADRSSNIVVWKEFQVCLFVF